ncbi:MFS transporter [Frondihabitans cladoniiphilus]|uniref:MFS transporter n=1 Tax=Frondihabitans cladoniiphilus TaxID=715785 RepID=A0ABP8VNR0_9MICO
MTTLLSSPAGAGHRSPSRWWILAVLSLAQLMVVLDSTIVNIALPRAQAALGFSSDDRQWVVTAYALSFGGLLLLGGRISDRWGQKRVLIIGLFGFAAASAVGGAAGTFGVLISARAAQGAFGALLAPAALSLLTIVFHEPAERTRAFGVFGSVSGTGAAVGLLLGGALTEYWSWAWCLWVNVPLAAIAIIGAIFLIPATAGSPRVKLDIPGTVTVVAGTVLLVLGFTRANSSGWSAASTITLLATGLAALLLFVSIQRRVKHPLLPLRIVLDRYRGGSLLGVALSALGIFAVFLFLTFYLQTTKGFTPLVTGVAFLPMIGAITFVSIAIAPPLLRRHGPRIPISLGALFGAAGLFWLSTLTTSSGYATVVLPALIMLGLGMGLVFGAGFNSATAGVRPDDAGVASALANAGQQIFGALGTALLSTFAVQATSAAAQRGAAIAAVAGYDRAFLVAAIVFLGAAVLTGLLIPRAATSHEAVENADHSASARA